MAITKTQTPYEFLVRWKDGKIAGAHVKFLEKVIDDDGSVLSEKEGNALPVSLAGEAGYPLADVLNFAQTTALATAESATADAAKAKNEGAVALAAEQAAHEATKAQLTEALANIPAPNVDANGVPQMVTMRQARLMLLGAGLLDKVQGIIDSLPEPQKKAALIDWDYSNTVERKFGLVSQLAPAMGMTEAQIDELFIAASKL